MAAGASWAGSCGYYCTVYHDASFYLRFPFTFLNVNQQDKYLSTFAALSYVYVFCPDQAHHAPQRALQLPGPLPEQVRQHTSQACSQRAVLSEYINGLFTCCCFSSELHPVGRFCWSDPRCWWPTMGSTERCVGSHLGPSLGWPSLTLAFKSCLLFRKGLYSLWISERL